MRKYEQFNEKTPFKFKHVYLLQNQKFLSKLLGTPENKQGITRDAHEERDQVNNCSLTNQIVGDIILPNQITQPLDPLHI